jgi:hypothetical protein
MLKIYVPNRILSKMISCYKFYDDFLKLRILLKSTDIKEKDDIY